MNDPEHQIQERGLFKQLVLVVWAVYVWLANLIDDERTWIVLALFFVLVALWCVRLIVVQ